MKNIFLTVLSIFFCSLVSAHIVPLCTLKSDTTKISSSKDEKARLKFFEILQIQNYEPNLIGYTFDSDDKPFLDFTFSASTRISPFNYLVKLIPPLHRPDLQLRFAFTVRFGQYIGTRNSNPVIEKRFNPYLFLQFSPKNKNNRYIIQTGYGHESNGQSIDDSLTFFSIASLPNNNLNQTRDKVSRGWDYIAMSFVANQLPKKRSKLIFEESISLKYYLDNGLMQGQKEEYNSWENDWSGPNYSRNKINGLGLSSTCFIDSSMINKLQVSYETGITKPLSNSSIVFTVGAKFGNVPFCISYRYGYAGDLAQFGKLNSSFNISVIIPSFESYNSKK